VKNTLQDNMSDMEACQHQDNYLSSLAEKKGLVALTEDASLHHFQALEKQHVVAQNVGTWLKGRHFQLDFQI
jgi:hypothetical protein